MRSSVMCIVFGLGFVITSAVSAQTAATASATDLYHVHFVKAAPGQAAALAKAIVVPDKTQPMPEHFLVLRHQEGDDWDYAVIQHLGPKTEITVAPSTRTAERDLRAWHTDTFVTGPSWAEFTKQMAIGGAANPNVVYIVGVHRPVPGHGDQLSKSLNAAPASTKVQTGNIFLQHVEGSEWSFMTITRYNSWQDVAAERTEAAAAAPAAGGWADIRQHSAFHRDTIADRIFPVR
jgi:hypothetical protein